MKKHMIYLAAVLALASCTLDEKIVSSSVKEEYYQTAEQCVTGLNGCYIPMRTVYANRKSFNFLLREGWRSFLSAFASI